jgi:glutathione synthase/RimK-type ligase-like ATP-grasp enzyme
VDLLSAPDGQQYLLEVNSIPGWQGLQSVSEVNIAEEIVAYLETQLKEQTFKDEASQPVPDLNP